MAGLSLSLVGNMLTMACLPWYALTNIVHNSSLNISEDESKGHEWCNLGKGVYCSEMLATAWDYSRPTILTNDNAYHNLVLVLKVQTTKERNRAASGNHQWVCESKHVALDGILVQCGVILNTHW